MAGNDKLYGGGVEVEEGFMLKAHAKVPVRALLSPAAQQLVSVLVEAWKDRLDSITSDVEAVLRRSGFEKSLFLVGADLQKSGDRPTIDQLLKATIAGAPGSAPEAPKANLSGQPRAQAGQGGNREYQRPQGGVHAPGSRGGKFYIDEHGKVRYGTRPVPGANEQEATPQQIAQHYKMFKPSPFLGYRDRDIINAMKELKDTGEDGVTLTDHQFISWWYEQDGLENFLESYGLSAKDLSLDGKYGGDLSRIQFTNGLSYEQNVHDFFLSQDFNDEDTKPGDEGYVTPEMVDDVLQDVFKRFNAALEDPAVQKLAEKKAEETEKKLYEYFQKAEAIAPHYESLAGLLVGRVGDFEADNDRRNNALIAMANLGLLFKPKTGEVNAGDLKGLLSTDAALLDEPEGKRKKKGGGRLFIQSEKLATMSPGQLMSVYMASSLHAVFDGKNYAVPTGDDDAGFPVTSLHEVCAQLIAKKMGLGRTEMDHITKALDDTAITVGEELNRCNTGGGGIARRVVDLPSSAIGDKAHIDRLVAEEEKFVELRKTAIEAQNNSDFGELPSTMDGGIWDGKHLNANGTTARAFAHQAQAINWMDVVKRGILALDAGMGKTPTVIAFMEKLKQKKPGQKALIFLPPSLMGQWPDEIASFAPGAKDKILNLAGMSLDERKTALKTMAKDAEYILISTGTLNDSKDTKRAGRDITGADGTVSHDPDAENDGTGGMDDDMLSVMKSLDAAVFVDEVHQGGYKTEGSVRYKMLKQVLKDREYAFGMSATPMPNEPMDLFNLTDLFHPNSVGERPEWEGALHAVHYDSQTMKWQVTNPQNIVNLNTRIKPFVFSKLITDPEVEADMGKQLPALRSDAVDVEPSSVKCPKTGFSQWDFLRPNGVCDFLAAKRVDEIEKERKAQGKPELDPFVVAGLLKVLAIGLKRQAAVSPQLILPDYEGASPKIDQMVDDIVSHFASCKWQPGQPGDKQACDKPVVSFTSFPDKAFPLVKKKLIEAGIDPSLIGEIYGAKTPAERAFMQDMTNSGKTRVLLVGTLSGGAGLNLQKASNRVFHLDEPWHPSAKRQAQGRVWRTGQKEPVHQSTYRVKGSYDMDIEEKIAGKQTMVSALLGKPDPEAFADNANEQITSLSGRVISDSLKNSQLGSLLDAIGDIPIDWNALGMGGASEEEDEEGNVPMEELSADDLNTMVQHGDEVPESKPNTSGQMAPPDMEKHKKALEYLKDVAPYIADKVNRGAEWKTWVQQRREKELSQRYEVKSKTAEMFEAAGEKDKAQEARTQAENIKKVAAQWHQGHAAEAEQHEKAGRTEEAAASRKRASGIEKVFPHLKEAAGEQGGNAARGKSKGSKSKGSKPEGSKPEGSKPASGGGSTREAAVAASSATGAGGGGAAPEAEVKPKAKKEPTQAPAKSEEVQHAAGFKLTTKKLAIGRSNSRMVGGVMSEASAHHLYNELLSNKDKSLEAFAERVVKPIWPGRWSRKDGVSFVHDVLAEFRKMKAVK